MVPDKKRSLQRLRDAMHIAPNGAPLPDISALIAPVFHELHRDIVSGGHTYYWLGGGRGSTKSSFASIELISGVMADAKANAVVLRKIGQYLRESVYSQLLWAIDALGVADLWIEHVSPMELIYKPTGQKIVFRGADEPRKIKSIKFKRGYCKFIWYEEVDEFAGTPALRTINQSLMRGGDRFIVFCTYNPPRSQRSWVNEEVLQPAPDRLVHHSTYLDVPPAWLGSQFYRDAEHLKETRPESYRHEYLGEVVGTEGAVFANVTGKAIPDALIKSFDNQRRGMDYGYASDPFAYVAAHYDKTRRKLYIFYEIYKVGLSNRAAVALIKQENKLNQPITADSAEPKSIAEMRELGLRVTGARKGPDSVAYGIKWLQDVEEIIIDPERCSNAFRELRQYELEPDGNGGFKAHFPDKDNHMIDALRYAFEGDMRRRENRALSVRGLR